MGNLETIELLIRKAKMEDVETAHNLWFADEKIAYELDFKPHMSLVETELSILSAIQSFEKDLPVWIIELKKTGKIIGYVKLLTSSDQNKRCDLIYYVTEEYAGGEYSKQALECVADYLFKSKGYETIVNGFYDTNREITEVKENLLMKIGMKREAILRNRRINQFTGKKENMMIYSLLKEEYHNHPNYKVS